LINKIKVRFLGTNGWYDTDTGNTICILIETGNEYVVLDAGNGIYKLDKFITDPNKPIYLFISHFHFDHIIGLHVLAKFRFKQGLNIVVPNGQKKLLKTIINKKFTLSIDKLPFKTKVYETPKEKNKIKFLLKCLPLRHPVPCYGFMFNFGDKVVSYVSDTGFCKNAVILAKDADLLITECAFKSDQDDIVWPHLNPNTAAQIAKQSNAKKLVLVHFDAEIYKTLKDRMTAQIDAKKCFNNTIAAFDDLEILI